MARRTGFSVGLRETLYNLTMRRNSVYVTFLVIGGFAATKFMGVASDYVWETYNKGVSRGILRVANFSKQCNIIFAEVVQGLGKVSSGKRGVVNTNLTPFC
jgi:hypothetical protein